MVFLAETFSTSELKVFVNDKLDEAQVMKLFLTAKKAFFVDELLLPTFSLFTKCF